MASVNPLLVGQGILPGPTFDLGHLVYVSTLGPPPLLSTYGAIRAVDAGSGVEYTGIPDGAGNYPVAVGVDQVFRAVGGIMSEAHAGDGSFIAGEGASVPAINAGATVVIGKNASGFLQQILIGTGANATTPLGTGDEIGIGSVATVGSGALTIGAASTASGNQSLNVGRGSGVSAAGAMGIGHGTQVSQQEGHAFGHNAQVTAAAAQVRGIAVGSSANVRGTDTILIGANGTLSSSQAIGIGGGLADLGANVAQIGGPNTAISTFVLGAGDTIAGPAARVIRFTNASGVDNAAGNITIMAPRSTGNATPGAIVLAIGQQVVGSSAVLQAVTNAIVITSTTAAGVPLIQIATGKIQLGAAAGTTAAINIDASTHGNAVLRTVNGASTFALNQTTTGTQLQAVTSGGNLFVANAAENKWDLIGSAANGTSRLSAQQAIAQLLGGSSNGLAIRNSANTRDNFQVADNGGAAVLNDGTRTVSLQTTGGTGALVAGGIVTGSLSTDGINIVPNQQGTNLRKVVIAYFNQTAWKSAAEVANVAAGDGTLSLMSAGGQVTINGGATGTASALYVKGSAYGAGVASIRLDGLTDGAGTGAGTITNTPNAAGGNPVFWIPINIAGTVRYVPAWAA